MLISDFEAFCSWSQLFFFLKLSALSPRPLGHAENTNTYQTLASGWSVSVKAVSYLTPPPSVWTVSHRLQLIKMKNFQLLTLFTKLTRCIWTSGDADNKIPKAVLLLQDTSLNPAESNVYCENEQVCGAAPRSAVCCSAQWGWATFKILHAFSVHYPQSWRADWHIYVSRPEMAPWCYRHHSTAT